ncbi:MAG: hypothetical protein Q4B31_04025 [Clostridia bacterium]|nr:hypothetical protein [Clostridia bacterium]
MFKIVCFVILIIVVWVLNYLWIEKHWVPVEATIVKQAENTNINSYSGEYGLETSTETDYEITYEFEYNGNTYQRNKRQSTPETKDIITIKIDSKDPENLLTPAIAIPSTLVLIGGFLIVCKWIFRFLKRLWFTFK